MADLKKCAIFRKSKKIQKKSKNFFSSIETKFFCEHTQTIESVHAKFHWNWFSGLEGVRGTKQMDKWLYYIDFEIIQNIPGPKTHSAAELAAMPHIPFQTLYTKVPWTCCQFRGKVTFGELIIFGHNFM